MLCGVKTCRFKAKVKSNKEDGDWVNITIVF